MEEADHSDLKNLAFSSQPKDYIPITVFLVGRWFLTLPEPSTPNKGISNLKRYPSSFSSEDDIPKTIFPSARVLGSLQWEIETTIIQAQEQEVSLPLKCSHSEICVQSWSKLFK